MEDRHTIVSNFGELAADNHGSHALANVNCSYTGVFDGHMGSSAAIVASKRLHMTLLRHDSFAAIVQGEEGWCLSVVASQC